jgi:hypothetical protein
MYFLRLRDALVMVVAIFLLGSSSQAAVCELACELPAAGCHAAPRVAASMESHDGMAMDGECDHAMKGAVNVSTDGFASCSLQSCGQVAATVFAKGDPAPNLVSVAQWVVVGAVPKVDSTVGDWATRGGRPPLLVGGAGSGLMSLRV